MSYKIYMYIHVCAIIVSIGYVLRWINNLVLFLSYQNKNETGHEEAVPKHHSEADIVPIQVSLLNITLGKISSRKKKRWRSKEGKTALFFAAFRQIKGIVSRYIKG